MKPLQDNSNASSTTKPPPATGELAVGGLPGVIKQMKTALRNDTAAFVTQAAPVLVRQELHQKPGGLVGIFFGEKVTACDRLSFHILSPFSPDP